MFILTCLPGVKSKETEEEESSWDKTASKGKLFAGTRWCLPPASLPHLPQGWKPRLRNQEEVGFGQEEGASDLPAGCRQHTVQGQTSVPLFLVGGERRPGGECTAPRAAGLTPGRHLRSCQEVMYSYRVVCPVSHGLCLKRKQALS